VDADARIPPAAKSVVPAAMEHGRRWTSTRSRPTQRDQQAAGTSVGAVVVGWPTSAGASPSVRCRRAAEGFDGRWPGHGNHVDGCCRSTGRRRPRSAVAVRVDAELGSDSGK